MNTRLIPVVLLAVVAIAAGFAFAPVEQASTVDGEILDGVCQIHNSSFHVFDGEGCTDTDEV